MYLLNPSFILMWIREENVVGLVLKSKCFSVMDISPRPEGNFLAGKIIIMSARDGEWISLLWVAEYFERVTWSIRSSVKSTLKQGFEYTQMIRCSLGEKLRQLNWHKYCHQSEKIDINHPLLLRKPSRASLTVRITGVPHFSWGT